MIDNGHIFINNRGNISILDKNGGIIKKMDTNFFKWRPTISPDGHYLIHGANIYDGTIVLQNIDTRETIKLSGHKDKIVSLCFSKNSKYILSASDDNTVRIWSIKGEALAQIKVVGVHFAAFADKDNYWVAFYRETNQSLPQLRFYLFDIGNFFNFVKTANVYPEAQQKLDKARLQMTD